MSSHLFSQQGENSGQTSSSSVQSILEGNLVKAASQVPIKQSKVKIKQKQVVLVTPVMIGSSGFSKVHQRTTLTYNNAKPLHQARFPKFNKDASPGLVINLGHTDTEN